MNLKDCWLDKAMAREEIYPMDGRRAKEEGDIACLMKSLVEKL